MSQTRSQSGKKIKEDKPERPQIILDVVSEYPKIEHIPEEMENSSMQEHGCKQSEWRRQPRNIGNGQRSEMCDLIGDCSHTQHIILQPARREYLEEKYQDIQHKKRDSHIGNPSGWVIVSERYKHLLSVILNGCKEIVNNRTIVYAFNTVKSRD